MITPAIPSWLPEKLWSGLHFEEMEPCARKWVKIIKEKENPDVIVGLFHAGKSGNVLPRKPSVQKRAVRKLMY